MQVHTIQGDLSLNVSKGFQIGKTSLEENKMARKILLHNMVFSSEFWYLGKIFALHLKRL